MDSSLVFIYALFFFFVFLFFHCFFWVSWQFVFFNMHCHYRLIYHLSSDMQVCFFSHNHFRRKVADSTGRA